MLVPDPSPSGWSQTAGLERYLAAGGASTYARDTFRKRGQRICFDTVDWYWRDEGSGHVPAVRYALLTSTAVEISIREKRSSDTAVITVKPYGLVWKGGEWWLVAAPPRGEPARYRLNHIDRLIRTDLRFSHPEEAFDLRQWWTQTLEDYGRGPNRVVLGVRVDGLFRIAGGWPAMTEPRWLDLVRAADRIAWQQVPMTGVQLPRSTCWPLARGHSRATRPRVWWWVRGR